MFGRIAISAVAVIVMASPAVSQQHQHRNADSTAPQQMMGQMGMMSMMDNPFMMRVMRFTPQNVTAHADALGLDDAQRAKIQEMQAPMEQHGQMSNMQSAMHALREAFDAENPDLDAIRAATDALGPMCSGMQKQHLTTAASVRALLTPGQREHLMLLPFSGMGMRMSGQMMNR